MKYSRVRAVHRSKSGPPMSALGQKQISPFTDAMSALPPKADKQRTSRYVRFGRVEDERGSLGHSATLRFPSPLIEPDVPD